jgi:transcriptional regulator with XRE-family HTH domain
VPKRKNTVEDHLDFIRWWREGTGLAHRESKHYLKELRKERGLTQKQLAQRAGVSQQFISRLESNWVNAGPKTIRRLASALEMDPLELTLIEVIYRETLAREEYDYLKDRYEVIEELDVDRWTLEEAVNWAGGRYFYPPEVDDEGYFEAGSPGISSQEDADRANAVMRRLRERYGSQEPRVVEDWWE